MIRKTVLELLLILLILKLLQMRNIIKKGLILLSLNLIPLVSHSQDSISLSTQQVTAIIFLEHQKLSNENPLLKQQIKSLEELNELYVKTDSIQKVEIKTYDNKVTENSEQIKKLKKNQKRIIIGSSIGGILLFILGLIL